MTVYAAMRDGLLVVRDGEATERLSDAQLECVGAHPERPERAFVGTFHGGLLRTTDGGESFERVDEFERDAAMSVLVDPADPDVVWAGTEPSAVYRTTDGGDSWEKRPGLVDLPSAAEWSFPPRPDTHHVRWLAVDPGDREHLYVGIEAGALVQTRDGGDTWADRVPGSRRDNHTLATHPDAPERVYAAAGDGYAESTTSGETWEHPQEGLDHRYVWGLGVDPGDPDTVLVSAASGARSAHNADSADSYVYRRRRGEPWERLDDRGLPMGAGVTRAVVERGREPGELYALNNRGLFRTTDAGDAWTQVDVAWPDRYERRTARGLGVV